MAENREEILANFQGITAIDDVAEAIYHLEETNWDLLMAINRVMPQDNVSTNSAQIHTTQIDDDSNDIDMIEVTPALTKVPNINDNDSVIILPSTSESRANKTIKFEVNYDDTIHNVEISESSTVSDLKKKLLSITGVAVCRQQLSGLGGSRAANGATLGSLNLPSSGTKLRLTVADDNMAADDDVADRLTASYILRIFCDPLKFTLTFPGTKTVLEVKTDVYSLTNIPVRHQLWTGWPSVKDLDNTVLALVGLNHPEHILTVKHGPVKPPPKEYKRIIVDTSESDQSSVEEFEDASESFTVEDDIFVDPVRNERLQPLLPEGVEDETIGCIEFAERFRQRYGPHCPQFFQGTLEDAIKEACHKSAKDRRLLGVYLHHESSVLTNVFCAQLLGCDSILQTLEANFVVYGWDLTFESNRNMLLSSVSNALGGVAGMTVRNIPVDRLPALIIIMRVRSNTEIYSVINGNVGVSELAGGLVEAVERFGIARAEDARTEDEREARQKVKQEQDDAYQLSLQADRAKEESKRLMQEEMHRQKKEEETERQRVHVKNEAVKAEASARLPPEPSTKEDGITKIRVRLPQGDFLERRFLQNSPLQALLDFLTMSGYHSDDYKVISSWPRRDLTNEDSSKTLFELRLYPQETVLLEER